MMNSLLKIGQLFRLKINNLQVYYDRSGGGICNAISIGKNTVFQYLGNGKQLDVIFLVGDGIIVGWNGKYIDENYFELIYSPNDVE